MKTHEDAACYSGLSDIKRPFSRKFAKELVFDKQLTFDKVTDVYSPGPNTMKSSRATFMSRTWNFAATPASRNTAGHAGISARRKVYEIVTDPASGRKTSIFIRQTACIARPAISRTRSATSNGPCPTAAMGGIREM